MAPRKIEVAERAGAAAPMRIALVASRFNPAVTDELLDGAREALREAGLRVDDTDVMRVPGAWELPWAAARLARSGRYAAVVALGCVIRGETPHFEFVAGEAARGLMAVGVETGVPVTFGVLTTDTLEQALARAGGPAGNKGREAALAALELAELSVRLDDAPARA